MQVNELQGRIKDTTRKMMSMVAELSMNQATALKYQQHLKEKEADLEQCYIRMEKGDAPSDDIDDEWQRLLRDEDRRLHDREELRIVRLYLCFLTCLKSWLKVLKLYVMVMLINAYNQQSNDMFFGYWPNMRYIAKGHKGY